MKKKVIFLVLCVVLLLIFTSLSYAKPDPKYIFRGDPWDRCLSTRIDENLNLDLVVVVIHPGFYFICPLQPSHVYNDSQALTNLKLDLSKNRDHLKNNERKPQE